MKKDNISELLERDAPEVKKPDSLSKENIVAMLKEKEITPKKKIKIFPKIMAAAAMFALILGMTYLMDSGLQMVINKEPPVSKMQDAVVQDPGSAEQMTEATVNGEKNAEIEGNFFKAKTDDELKKIIETALKSKIYTYNVFAADIKAPTSAVAQSTVPESEKIPTQDSAVGYGNEASETNRSETNTQVEGVDEADIIKNDGRYIYIVYGHTYSGYGLKIFDTETMTVVTDTQLTFGGTEDELAISDIYVYGNTLVAICGSAGNLADDLICYNKYKYSYDFQESQTTSIVYDITDKGNIKKINEVCQDGTLLSTRMNGTVLYTVTNYTVFSEEKYKPTVNGFNLPCDDIYISDKDSTNYIVLTAYDTANNESEVGKVSILGSGYEVYCSKNAMYVINQSYDTKNQTEKTDIHKFTLNGITVAYAASGEVTGSSLNQFSMDENGGYLRIATTVYKNGEDVSSVYVLDDSLKLVGKLENIADDEQVKAVRFMGDVGYVVTFRNTDPLFVLDLKDPKNPEIDGEIKIPGYSSYLHPVGEGYVVGIGYDGDENGEDTETVKLSVFDVSDPKNPKETDKFVIDRATTAAQYNHKAVIYSEEGSFIGVPVAHNIYYKDKKDQFTFEIFEVKNGKLTHKNSFAHEVDNNCVHGVHRGVYIGDKFYSVYTSYSVIEFDMTTGKEIRRTNILNEEEIKRLNEMPGVATTEVPVAATSAAEG